MEDKIISHREDFIIRSSTYLIVCSTYMLDEKVELDKLEEHAEFIERDAKAKNLKKVYVRLYTEKDASQDGISIAKNLLNMVISNLEIIHIPEVAQEEIYGMIAFANNYGEDSYTT